MRALTLTATLYVACALQPRLAAGEGWPSRLQAPAIVAGMAVLLVDGPAVLLWAAAAGFVSDGLAPAPFGLDIAGFVLAAFLARRLLGRRPVSSFAALLAAWGGVTLVARGVSVAGRAAWSAASHDPTHLAGVVGGEVAASLAAAAAVWALVRIARRAWRGPAVGRPGWTSDGLVR